MVIIDGRRVRDSEVDAVKHCYLGMFRCPREVALSRLYEDGPFSTSEFVTSGGVLVDKFNRAYLEGRWDEPQYVTIK